MSARSRRAPRPEERRRDAERSRRLLLDAGLHEFADKGYAGARVADIADRAGMNKQLINYYFGGKEGLYRELQRRWHDRESVIDDPRLPLSEVAVRYLHEALNAPYPARLGLWQALCGDAAPHEPDEDLARMVARQAHGELAADLDPPSVLLAVMGMVLAPIAMPHQVARHFGVPPDSAEFERRYGDQMRRMIERLTAARCEGPAGASDGTPPPAE